MQRRALPQSILSAYHQDLLTEAVTQFDIADYFAHIVGRTDHYAISKIDAGQQLINQLALAPEHILLVGDTLHDFEVAQALGIQCVLIGNGHQHPDRLQACGVPVFNSITKMIESLEI
jgi:phosphoglycolate phosphatase